MLGVSAPAKADFLTGNELFAHCTAPETDPVYFAKRSSCREYITGVHDGIEATSGVVSYALDRAGDPIRLVCAPPGVTARQMRDVVVTYLERHPETRHQSASLIIFGALGEAFPCPES
ncbi:Rap1a/Tai family immunity protein [Brevundimonas sp.]|uniref:Rap1a/Tai family immunity protein n=1 Tax=Brevundimonas sp. TaxID=1871086 RepID=UPI00391B9669